MKRSFIVVTAVAILCQIALAGEHDHDHSKRVSLGVVKIGDYEVEAFQEGAVVAGKETVFELKLKGAPEPTAIRAWIGIESARGSVKAKSHKHDDEISIHCESPDPIPEGAMLWIELETPSGKLKGSLKLKRD